MKHAYLILAHHEPEVLQLLLTALDDARNDIFLHMIAARRGFLLASRSGNHNRLAFPS